ncbi:disulfide bond formation protein B [Kordiimonas pumila]|uniref:Disulfide bond formation protein B n=1 Tax=Kordiimonas pumila TaxID=2161677 RepID=A0ABV7D0N9_9PROT|nr:disulfide bond formation protein B [Kordiimonas pumila]
MKNFTLNDPVLFAGLIAALVLGAAFTFQLFGYPPCELCWWQRYPYMAIMGVSIVGTAVRALPRRVLLVVLALLFLTDAGIAGFHAGVEQRWWEGLSTCSGYVDITDNIDDALKSIMNAPLVRCDDVAWSLFGISMAGYNLFIAAFMAFFCIFRLKAVK